MTTGYKHLHHLNGQDAAVFTWLTALYGDGCLLWLVRS